MEVGGGDWQWEMKFWDEGFESSIPYILTRAAAVLYLLYTSEVSLLGYAKSGLYQLFIAWHNIQSKVMYKYACLLSA